MRKWNSELLILAALVLGTLEPRAAVVEVFQPIGQPGQYILNIALTNPNEGTYNSATFTFFQNLHQAGLNPTVTVRQDADPFTGWTAGFAADGTVELTNNGQFVPSTSIPLFTIWDTETMAVASTVGSGALERNPTPGHQPFTLAEVLDPAWDPAAWDAIIVRSDHPLLLASNHIGPQQHGQTGSFVALSASGLTTYTGTAPLYLLLEPTDFAPWTDFATTHPGLDPAADANHNGRSNFLDYATGQDPLVAVTLPAVELHGTTLTLRRRVDALDANATAEFSDSLSGWLPLEEGIHFTPLSNTVTGPTRTLVLQLLNPPPARFFRQRFE